MKDSHKIYVICEGKGTEPDYFAFFEGLSSNLQVITIPPTTGTDPLKLMELSKEVLAGENRLYTINYQYGDTVWFVIDTDTWETEGKIAPLRQYCTDQNQHITNNHNEVKAYNAWNVAQSNPSFEIWLYYHIYDSKPTDEEVEKVHSFKEYVNSKISGGFNSSGLGLTAIRSGSGNVLLHDANTTAAAMRLRNKPFFICI